MARHPLRFTDDTLICIIQVGSLSIIEQRNEAVLEDLLAAARTADRDGAGRCAERNPQGLHADPHSPN